MLLFLIGCFQVDGDEWNKWEEENSGTGSIVFQQEATISADVEVGTGVELTCTAAGVDGGGNILTPTYIWKKGVVELGADSTYVVSADDTDVGDTITCVATITDSSGNVATSEDSATINNTPPVISAVTIAPDAEAYNDSSLTCSAEILDPDEEIQGVYSWEIGGSQIATGETIELIQYASLEIMPTQLITCSVSVSDSQGEEDASSNTVTIKNRDPIIENVQLSSDSFEANAEVSCAADVSDPDGEETTVSYSWTMDGADLGLTDSSITLSPEQAPVDGVLACIVSAEDGYGGTNSEIGTEVIINTAPDVTEISIDINPNIGAYADSVLTCEATASDLNDGDLSLDITYLWTRGVDHLGLDAILLLDSSVVSPDDVLTCTASVTDANGAIADLSTDVTILNTPPVVYDVVVSPSSAVYTGTELGCMGAATDYNDGNIGSSLSYEWSVNGISVGTGVTYTVDASQTDVGDTIVCTASVTDLNGAAHQETAEVTIENTAPEFDSLPELSAYSLEVGETVSCILSATDIDEDTLSYSYQWYDGAQNVLGADEDLVVPNLSIGEEIFCDASVTDGVDTGTPQTSTSATIINSAPEITSVEISPNTGVTTSSLLSCSSTASDVHDGDLSSSISYSWSSDSGESSQGDSWQLDNLSFAPNDIITCIAEVTDSQGLASSDSVSVTVINSEPIISNLQIFSLDGAAFTDSELNCSASASDPDEGDIGSSLSYEWSVNGVVVGSGASYIIDASQTDVGDDIVCTASVGDSLGANVTDTTSIAIENTAPVVSDVQISSPSGNYYNDETWTCSANIVDPDDFPSVQYIWKQSGSSLGNGINFDPSAFSLMPSDSVTCEVVADDFIVTSSEETTVSIGNRPPSNPTATISWSGSGSVPSTTDDLTCIGEGAVEPDGQTMTYSIVWTSNLGQMVFGDSLSASQTLPSEEWLCQATASDGAAVGIGEASVTINSKSWDECPSLQSLAAAEYSFIGENSGDLAGIEVSSAGDIDGDGLDDILVGANSYSAGGQSFIGRVYLILGASLTGGAINLSEADYIFTGENPNDYFGGAVVSAGDVDGDGLDDILLSALWADDNNTTNVGKTYLFFGSSIIGASGSNISATDADYIFIGESAEDLAGTLGQMGDVDGDGLSDILIGSRFNDTGGQDVGKAYLIFGSSLGGTTTINLSNADYSFVGNEAGEHVGHQVTAAGDVDGDGLSDILIASRYNSDGGPQAGKIYLVLGASLSSSVLNLSGADYSFIGEDSGDQAGYSLSFGGDVDGDGLDDILIGSPYHNANNVQSTGKTYLISGSSLGSSPTIDLSIADYSFIGENADDQAGFNVNNSGDIDGDGLNDILISSYQYDFEGVNNVGKGYVFLGSSLGSTAEMELSSADYSFVGDEAGGFTSRLNRLSGDIDGDGLDEIIIGTPWSTLNGSDAGKISIFSPCEFVNDPPTEPELTISWSSGGPTVLDSDNLTCTATGSVDPEGFDVTYSYVWYPEFSGPLSGPTAIGSITAPGEQWTCSVTVSDGTESATYSTSVTVGCGMTDCDFNLALDDTSVDMVAISAGTDPLGQYSLSTDFYMMTTEVTQGLFYDVMGYNSYIGRTTYDNTGSFGVGDNYPAHFANWYMAADFANAMTQHHNATYGTNLSECYSCINSGNFSVECTQAMDSYSCDGYRLPTEAEWEYAYHSGSPEDFWTPNGGGTYSSSDCLGSETIEDGSQNPPLIGDYAWYCGNDNVGGFDYGTKEVGQLLPNGFGLYDMQGNLWEWTTEYFGCTFPNGTTDPECLTADNRRVLKGGSFGVAPFYLTSAHHGNGSMDERRERFGFRLARKVLTAPFAADISFSVSDPIEEVDDLICNIDVDAFDPNGDPVSYTFEWEVDGYSYNGTINTTTHSGDTIPSSEISSGEIWTCIVTPNDGNEDGPQSIASVQVLGDVLLLGNGFSVEMMTIPAGTEPLARYSLSNDFYMMRTEVTQGQFNEMMGYQAYVGETTSDGIGSYGVGDNYPAYYANWHMAADFANALTQQHNSTHGTSLSECYSCSNSGTTSVSCSEAIADPYQCDGYRMPTVAEWEYAARSGSQYDIWTANGGGNFDFETCDGTQQIANLYLVSDYVWYCGNNNIQYGSKEVGQLGSNGFGLYDMHGNVSEWTNDWQGCTSPGTGVNPYCGTSSQSKIHRGGQWDNSTQFLTASFHNSDDLNNRYVGIGFRLMRIDDSAP